VANRMKPRFLMKPGVLAKPTKHTLAKVYQFFLDVPRRPGTTDSARLRWGYSLVV